jgi:hypothetical protein
MTTPPYPFDLALAKLGWTIVQRCGRPARLLGELQGEEGEYLAAATTELKEHERLTGYKVNGRYYPDTISDRDLFLSSDTTLPAVREAMRKAHEAGAEVWVRQRDGTHWCKTQSAGWAWGYYTYILAQHLPEAARNHVPQPPPAQPMVPWDCMEDVPEDACYVETVTGHNYLITGFTCDGIKTSNGSSCRWFELKTYAASFHGPWLPCTKGAKP